MSYAKIDFSPNFSEYCPTEPANLFPIPIAAKYKPITEKQFFWVKACYI